MLKLTRRRAMSAFAAGVMTVAGTATLAADYPTKPITMIIPYQAGGSTETMGRLFAIALGNELGTKVVVKTRPGAGGAVGATELAAANPDGYTIMFAAASSLLWPPLTQEVEFDLNSFDYIAQITEYQQAIVAKADAPFNTVEELVAYAAENSLSFADQSAISRAFINYVGSEEGVSFTGVPTKGGGEMVPFLLGGKVDFAWSGGVHNRYGEDMKVLLSMNADRLIASPDVPSMGETYGVSMPSQAVIVAPKGTPSEVIATLEAAVERATTDADFADMVTDKLQFPVKFVGSEDVTAVIAATADELKTVIEATK